MGFLVRQVVFAASSSAIAAERLHDGPDSGVICDPGPVGLWNLEAILSARSFDDVVAVQPDPVALFTDGQKLILALSASLRDDLADVRGWRAIRVVRRWAQSDEVRAERLRPAETKQLTQHLRRLAREAAECGDDLYLWVDVDERAIW